MSSTKRDIMFALDESPCAMAALNFIFTTLLKDNDHLSVVACVQKDEETEQMIEHAKV